MEANNNDSRLRTLLFGIMMTALFSLNGWALLEISAQGKELAKLTQKVDDLTLLLLKK